MDILSLPILEWGGMLPFGLLSAHLPVPGHGWETLANLAPWLTPMGTDSTGSEISHTLGLVQQVLAQQFEQTDLAGQVQDAWTTFVETGQIWAMAIGIIFGYMFRTFTS